MSAVAEADRETSSRRLTDSDVQQLMSRHINRVNKFISSSQERATLHAKSNQRQKQLLTNLTGKDMGKQITEVKESIQFFISNFKNASHSHNVEILSVANRLPHLQEIHRNQSFRNIFSHLCDVLSSNVRRTLQSEQSSTEASI